MNVPSKVDTIGEVLLRLPSQSELVPNVKEHTEATTCMTTLDALKANNPLYADMTSGWKKPLLMMKNFASI